MDAVFESLALTLGSFAVGAGLCVARRQVMYRDFRNLGLVLRAVVLSNLAGPLFLWHFDTYGMYADRASLLNVWVYLLTLEYVQYVGHRLMHTRALYWMHKKHHEAGVALTPADTAVYSVWEALWVIFVIYCPMWVVAITRWELYALVCAVSGVQFLQHSDAYAGHHYRHHVYLKGNYGFVLPVWDYVFGTYIM